MLAHGIPGRPPDLLGTGAASFKRVLGGTARASTSEATNANDTLSLKGPWCWIRTRCSTHTVISPSVDCNEAVARAPERPKLVIGLMTPATGRNGVNATAEIEAEDGGAGGRVD